MLLGWSPPVFSSPAFLPNKLLLIQVFMLFKALFHIFGIEISSRILTVWVRLAGFRLYKCFICINVSIRKGELNYLEVVSK